MRWVQQYSYSELFENNVNLKRIEVKENLISFISIKLFKNTKNLEQLYLHENKIRKLRPKERWRHILRIVD